MKKFLFLILMLVNLLQAAGQSISSNNFSYLYDPLNASDPGIKIVNGPDSVHAYYRIDTTKFIIHWERRDSYGQRAGTELKVAAAARNSKISFPLPTAPWLLTALVTNKETGVTRLYYRIIEAHYPVNALIRSGGAVHPRPYLQTGTVYEISMEQKTPLTVYLYKADFPASSPPFTDKGAQVDPVLGADSVFHTMSNTPVAFPGKGLYLVQADTNSAKGISFRVMDKTYPKTTKMMDLADPMIFLCTKEEFDKLAEAGEDKLKFDQVILGITRDKDRAKNIMRNYFRRVELANEFFTYYKEGWKTDKGMIYLIFGIPGEVTRTGSNEIWYYKDLKTRFIFLRSGSLYDPENYSLVRDKRFRETWYYTIDLWRKDMMGATQPR